MEERKEEQEKTEGNKESHEDHNRVESSKKEKFDFEKFYDKNFKLLTAIPVIFMIICCPVLQ